MHLNVGTKTLKHLEENTVRNLCDFELGKDLLGMLSREEKAIQ